MNRKLLFGMVWPLLFIICAAGAGAQEEMERLDNYHFDAPRRPAALFSHDAHNEQAGIEDCTLCHHAFDENGIKSEYESSEDQACTDCHALQGTGRIPALRKAFHQRCRGCHLAVRQGPVVCANCHTRQ